MNGSVRLGRIAGVPLRMHWSAPLLIVFVSVALGGGVLSAWAPGHSAAAYRTGALIGALALAVSLVAHETAHALAARRAKIEVKDVTVFALGGVTRMGSATTPRDEGWVAAIGPLTNLVLGGLCLAAAVTVDDTLHWAVAAAVLAWVAWANGLLGVFNLLPAAPLDGGRVLQAVIWRIRGDRERAARISGRCGQVFGVALLAGGWLEVLMGQAAGLWLVLLGAFISLTAYAEVRRSVLYETLRGVRVIQAMRPAVAGQDWHTVDAFLATSASGPGVRTMIPLTDLDGRPSGVVTASALMSVPAARRRDTRVRDVALPLDRCLLVDPDDRVTDVFDRLATTSGSPVLVLHDNRVVGVVTAEDIAGLTRRHPHPPARPRATHGAGHTT
ncbi:site-2 protease family protein [Streptomyces sp. CBMA29]|uniref:site-2 protease family protein n=1 Tax=Streptomyces sp. CBMA29 TaxID=1896314 RepID=UPI001661C400|nr:site-2 protease family protein [Streptomyces sp. CBMA29]MBD0734725.1 hypothetical protein [Streptomyces sp. CBMA29]